MRIGVFGGTFNPIHRGHIHIAHRVKRLFDLTRINFVVATSPPHKPLEELVPLLHRYAMVGLATMRTNAFVPSLIELEQPASPFSVHTMEKFAGRNGEDRLRLYFIAGGDSLLEVSSWRESVELLSSYNFIFVARPRFTIDNAGKNLPTAIRERILDLRGLADSRIRKHASQFALSSEARIFVLDAQAPDISSSHIRARVAAGEPIDRLVPSSVHQYIQKLNLYGER